MKASIQFIVDIKYKIVRRGLFSHLLVKLTSDII